MADLSARLPTEIDSQQRFIQPPKAATPFLETLANFGSDVVGVADTAIKAVQNGSAKKNAKATLKAQNDAAKGFVGLFSDQSAAPSSVLNTPTDDPAHNAAVAQVKAQAPAVLNQQTAADQGKIDPAMAQAKSLAVVRQVMAANPGHEAAVVTAFRELGVTNMVTQQYANAEKGIESNQEAQAATIHAQENAAVTKWGYTNYYQMSKPEQAQTLAQVGLLEAQEQDLEAKTKQADLALKNVDLTDKTRTQLQTQLSDGLKDSALSYMNSSFSNLNKILINQIADPSLSPADAEKLQSRLLSVAIPSMDQVWATQMVPKMANMLPADRDFLTNTYKTMKENLTGILSGPQSIVETNKRILENLSNTYGIDYSKSAPTLLRIQKLIGPQALGVLLSPSIEGNAQLQKMLSDELKGAISDPSRVPSFTEHVMTLGGQANINQFSPEKIMAMAPAQLASVASLSRNTVASNGTDPEAHKALVNAVKNTSGIAVDVVPQWGFKNILNQGKILNSNGVTRALFFTNENHQERIDAIHSWIPATTNTYLNLATSKADDNFYDVKLDPHTLQWSAVWNGKMDLSRSTSAGMIVGGLSPSVSTTTTPFKPKPSTEVLEQAATLNQMLGNLSQAGSKKYDDVFNGKNVSYTEARKFYATGEIPASLQKPTKDKSGKTPEANVEDAISHMLDFVNKLPPSQETTTSTVKPGVVGPSPYAGAIGASAEKYGVPTNIAAALFHSESSGGRNPKDSSKGAVGPGQVMPGTALHYGVTDLHSLKPEDNIDLALHVLSDNYKATGNWHDALSMYHSGVDLATATRQGRTDGHMKTADYVASTMGAASSISAENLARYGYVRR